MADMNILKSFGAIVAGFASVAMLSVATDALLESTGVFPPQSGHGLFVTWMLVLAFTYRSLYAVVGGFVTAALSPTKRRDVTILAVLGTLGGMIGVVAGWDLSAHWYPIALACTAYPLVWFGGKLYRKYDSIL